MVPLSCPMRKPMLELFFTLLISRCTTCVSLAQERTLAMIKPDGLAGNYKDRIKEIIVDSGFRIIKEKTIRLDQDRAELFYAEHSSKSFFPALIKYMTSGPVQVMVLEKLNAVVDWRTLIGPTDARKAKVTHRDSIRAMCGFDSEKNCVHGSDSAESAEREISFFFGCLSPGLALSGMFTSLPCTLR